MDDEEILQMVVDGELEDFRDLDDGLQDRVRDGDISLDGALSLIDRDSMCEKIARAQLSGNSG